MLTEMGKKHHMASVLSFLETYSKDGHSLVDHIVIGDENRLGMLIETTNQSIVLPYLLAHKNNEVFADLVREEIYSDKFRTEKGYSGKDYGMVYYNQLLICPVKS